MKQVKDLELHEFGCMHHESFCPFLSVEGGPPKCNLTGGLLLMAGPMPKRSRDCLSRLKKMSIVVDWE